VVGSDIQEETPRCYLFSSIPAVHLNHKRLPPLKGTPTPPHLNLTLDLVMHRIIYNPPPKCYDYSTHVYCKTLLRRVAGLLRADNTTSEVNGHPGN